MRIGEHRRWIAWLLRLGDIAHSALRAMRFDVPHILHNPEGEHVAVRNGPLPGCEEFVADLLRVWGGLSRRLARFLAGVYGGAQGILHVPAGIQKRIKEVLRGVRILGSVEVV